MGKSLFEFLRGRVAPFDMCPAWMRKWGLRLKVGSCEDVVNTSPNTTDQVYRKCAQDVSGLNFKVLVGDWVRIKLPHKVAKGLSKFSTLFKVDATSRFAVRVNGKSWWNLSRIYKIPRCVSANGSREWCRIFDVRTLSEGACCSKGCGE